MKKAFVAVALLAACTRAREERSAFLGKGVPAVFAAIDDVMAAFDEAKRNVPAECVITLSSRLAEQASRHGARGRTRGYSAPNRFTMTYTAGRRHGDVVITES